MVHGKRGLVKLATLSPDNAIEWVVHGCDVLNKRGFARPYVLSEHTLVKNINVRNSHEGNLDKPA